MANHVNSLIIIARAGNSGFCQTWPDYAGLEPDYFRICRLAPLTRVRTLSSRVRSLCLRAGV